MSIKDQEHDWPHPLAEGDGSAAALLRKAARPSTPSLDEAAAWDRTLARLARDAGRPRLRLGLVALGGVIAGAAAFYCLAPRRASSGLAPRAPVAATSTAAPAPLVMNSPARAASPSPSPSASPSPSPPSLPPPSPAPIVRDVPGIQLGRAAVGLPIGPVDLIGEAQVTLARHGQAHAFSTDAAATVDLRVGTLDLQVEKRQAIEGRGFDVVAGPYRFTVLGTHFRVVRGRRTVTLAVSEGRVAVYADHDRLALIEAGGRWNGGVAAQAVRSLVMRAERARDRDGVSDRGVRVGVAGGVSGPHTNLSMRELSPDAPSSSPPPVRAAAVPPSSKGCGTRAQRDPQDGLECFLIQARGRELPAEVALYQAARVRRDALSDPAGALSLLREHRRRFPSGALRLEVELSIAELLAKLGRYREALDQTTALLSENPRGERLGELQLLRGHLLREGFGDCAGAERAYAAASVVSVSRAADPAAFWRAVCLQTLGRREEARHAYAGYLARPDAALAAEARARLAAIDREHSPDREPLTSQTQPGGSP